MTHSKDPHIHIRETHTNTCKCGQEFPKDPQADLHKLFRQICLRWGENQPHADPYHAYDEIYKEFAPKFNALFQAHQQALLTELLEQKIYGHLAVPNCTHFVPVSVIERKIGGLNG